MEHDYIRSLFGNFVLLHQDKAENEPNGATQTSVCHEQDMFHGSFVAHLIKDRVENRQNQEPDNVEDNVKGKSSD